MVATNSKMIPLGTTAPTFNLLNVCSGEEVNFSRNTKGKGFLMAFICNHCPFVIHLREHFTSLFNKYQELGIKVYAISSNDSQQYPADSPDEMAILAKKLNFCFPYLHDSTQEIAKKYKATCTPDFFLFEESKNLFYRGQYDNSRPSNKICVTGEDITNAVNLMLEGKKPPQNQIPSLGCNIKWK